MDSYNLLSEHWIPVLYRDGTWTRVGIRKALEDAGQIRQIAASNPMDRVAILRFLLAVLYWCKGNPPNDADPTAGESFPSDWLSKLDDNKHCFDLLGQGKRFYQDRTAHRHRAATDLIQEIPTGNNFWHFRHSTDQTDGICPACCATGLLRLPLFSVSGLPNLKAGINGTPPIYAVPWGASLLETLLANWVRYSSLGEPAWVQADVRPTPAQDVPLLTGLTLLSRRVWLHDPTGPPALCMGCGIRETALIRTCEFQSAGDQKNDLWNDPHVVYSNATPRKASKAPDLTAASKFRMDRPWPDLLARMAQTGKFGSRGWPVALLVVGFATDQAKNIDVWERTISLPSAASIQGITASLLQQWHKEGGRMGKRLGRSEIEGSAAIAAVRPHIEGKVSANAGKLLAGGETAWEQAAQRYRPMMEMIAKSLSPGFTSAAVRRRRQIANVAPDMRSRAQAPMKPGRKKGGDK